MVRVSIFLIAVVLIVGMVGCDGDESVSPQIRTWYDLDAVRDKPYGHYVLLNNLDSTTAGYEKLASPRANQGKGWEPIKDFTGTFEGQGYEIRNLFINREESYIGLFGSVYEGAVIKNLGVADVSLTGYNDAGGLVGCNAYLSLGITGEGGTVINCFTTGKVTGWTLVGGLVGFNTGTVSNSYSTSNVAGHDAVGGLVGDNHDTVSNCYATGSVTGGGAVGGLMGINWRGTVGNSYSTGSVTGENHVGGLMGENAYGTVSNSYYNYDEVLINGENIITIGALFGGDFDQWLANNRFLDINERLTQESDYYVISDVHDFKQLLVFGQNGTLKFRLINDLDLGDESNLYIPYLAGEFDGNGHKISNLGLNFDFVSHVGLFGYLTPGGKVIRVGVENVNITGVNDVGGLVGWNQGTVNSCNSTGNVTGTSGVGGLVGWNQGGTVSDSCSTCSVNGSWEVGGLLGQNNHEGTVSDSRSAGSVTGDGSVGGLLGMNTGTVSNSYSISIVTGNERVGGLMGKNDYGAVSNSYSTGAVTGYEDIGGLVGSNWGSNVSNSYATGNVLGHENAGGLVGYIYDGIVTASYSTGSVTGNYSVGGLVGENERGSVKNSYSTSSLIGYMWVGGLVGYNDYDSTVSNSYSIGTVTGTTSVGGLVGRGAGSVINSFWDIQTSGQSTSDGGIGKTTAEMQDISTFSGATWNITAVTSTSERNPAYIWNIVDSTTYPFLSWQS